MTKEDEKLACIRYDGEFPLYSWILENIKKISPFEVRGKLGLFEVEVKDG